MNFSKYLFIER